MVKACDPKTLTVHSLMQDAVYTVGPQTTGVRIADILSEHGFGSVPVVDDEWTLLGLVTEFDLLRALQEGRNLRDVTAREVMTPHVITVHEEMPVMDLIKLLQERHLIRVPVVQGKKLIGIVARRDVLFGYVKATSTYWP
jgi:CBS domain-containing protein